MAELIGIVGFAGTGKSTSLRNLPSEETFIISPSKDKLPIPGFKSKYKLWSKENPTGNFLMTKSLETVTTIIKKIDKEEKWKHIKYIVIEDMTHFFNSMTLSADFRAQNSGNAAFSRWADFGSKVYQALFENVHEYRDDLTIVTIYHPEKENTIDGEKLKIKTPGSLLEKTVDLPSYYTNLLYTYVVPVDKNNPVDVSERYKFVTNDDGYHPAKTMNGLFDELLIDNNLYAVLNRIKEYEEIG
jgi:hypothetical protein